MDSGQTDGKEAWIIYNNTILQEFSQYHRQIWYESQKAMKHEKNTSKMGYFGKIAEIFDTPKTGSVCQDSWKLS